MLTPETPAKSRTRAMRRAKAAVKAATRSALSRDPFGRSRAFRAMREAESLALDLRDPFAAGWCESGFGPAARPLHVLP